MFIFTVGNTRWAKYNWYARTQKAFVTLNKDSSGDSACHNNSTYFNL